MKIVEAYQSDNGSFHRDKIRAAASDLYDALPSASFGLNDKVLGFSDCLKIFKNLDVVKKAIADFEATGEIASPEGK